MQVGGPGQLLTAATILDRVPLVGAVRLLQLSLILVPPPISPLSRRMPVTVLPRPLETCTSHSGLFFFSLLFPRLLPGFPGILLPYFCRPSQPIRALGLSPSKPADHMCSELLSLWPLYCCSPPTLESRGAPAGGVWLSF